MRSNADAHLPSREALALAAAWIAEADALVIAAGAGIGVDSGLPDFRGSEGFWKAYPALGRARLAFEEVANPAAFRRDPLQAWGFYGHRLALYRRTRPHPGFGLLHAIGRRLRNGLFVFTSNVDGQFQRAGYEPERILEVHGSIHHLQCQQGCAGEIWPADGFVPEIDENACRLLNPPPRCPHCGAIARPNILMFGDGQWLDDRSAAQERRYLRWRQGAGRVVTLEIGAGVHVPTVRRFAEASGGRLIRLNPQPETRRPSAALHLCCGALPGIEGIHAALAAASFFDTRR
jgi:NAD-dependent SIR2 family protein deacetylase